MAGDFSSDKEKDMTPQQFIAVGIRLAAIGMALASLKYVISIPVALARYESLSDKAAYSYWIGAIYFGVAVLLWFFPMSLAHKIAPRTQFDNHVNLQGLEAARVGCALIGLWFLFNGASDLVWLLFRALLVTGDQSGFQTLAADTKVNIAVSLFEAVFAVILIFRAADFARLVFRPLRAQERVQHR